VDWDNEPEWIGGRPPTPEHHKIIPPEVLDPKAFIPPSKFHFRRLQVVEQIPVAGHGVAENDNGEAIGDRYYGFLLFSIRY